MAAIDWFLRSRSLLDGPSESRGSVKIGKSTTARTQQTSTEEFLAVLRLITHNYKDHALFAAPYLDLHPQHRDNIDVSNVETTQDYLAAVAPDCKANIGVSQAAYHDCWMGMSCLNGHIHAGRLSCTACRSSTAVFMEECGTARR